MRDRLFTINKWNKKRIFWSGGTTPAGPQNAAANTAASGAAQGAGGGGGNIAGAVSGIAGAVTGIANTAISNAQIDEEAVQAEQEQIDENRAAQASASSYDTLLSQWTSWKPQDQVSWKDIRGSDAGDAAMSALGAAAQGASAGAALGPIGAAAGAVIGGLASGIGSGIGRRKAKKKAAELNKQILQANRQRVQTFALNAENIDANVDKAASTGFLAEGGYLNTFKDGGGIHIKPENRGKFTALKKRTGKSASWFKEHGTPAQKKMATFALNARKWKHDDGGSINDYYYPGESVLNYILDTEHYEPKVYQKNSDKETIGFGFTDKNIIEEYRNKDMSKDEALNIFYNKYVPYYVEQLKTLTPNFDKLNVNQKDALFSLMYNIGPTKYSKKSPSLMRALREENWGGAANEMNHGETQKGFSKGLSKRRKYERDKFLSPVSYNDYVEHLPENLRNTDPSVYDLEGAYKAGLKPEWNDEDKSYHLGSRDPKTGKFLKKPLHPTYLIGLLEDTRAGYYPYWKGKDLYTDTWEGNKNTQKMMNRKSSGGFLDNIHGGVFSNGVIEINNGGTHEENPNEGVQLGMDFEGTPNLVEEGEVVWNDYVFSNRLTVPKDFKKLLGLNNKKDLTFAEAATSLNKESKERPNDPISMDGLTASLSRLRSTQEIIRNSDMKRKYKKSSRFDYGGDTDGLFTYTNNAGYYPEGIMPEVTVTAKRKPLTIDHVPVSINYSLPQLDIQPVSYPESTGYFGDGFAGLSQQEGLGVSPADYNINGSTPEVAVRGLSTDKNGMTALLESGKKQGNKKGIDLSALRYMPAIGSAIQALVGNRPDYENADMIGRAANSLSMVKAAPVGNYLSYNPMDRNYYINKLNASAAATRRTMANLSGGSAAAARAGILASDYKAQLGLGNLARQAEEYNLAQRERVQNFNRATNMYNSESALKADMANQAQERARLEAKITQAQMRENIKRATEEARGENLTNFFDNIGNIGWEAYNRNMVNSNRALYYGTDGSGNSYYKGSRGNGGYLTINHKKRRRK